MQPSLVVTSTQYSHPGPKEINQDFQGAVIPREPELSLKGAAFAIADGISTSSVSQVASEIAVTNFLSDYYCASEAWSAKTAGIRVLASINGWLHAQTQKTEHRFNRDKGYVCTFSALVLKADKAHIFHVGDSRVYRIRDGKLEQLTRDHRVWTSKNESFLSNALGAQMPLEPDYLCLELKVGDCFLLCTDGIYEHWQSEHVLEATASFSPDTAKKLVNDTLSRGSQDNLTLQCIRIDDLSTHQSSLLQGEIERLPVPELMRAGDQLDGLTIIRAIHVNSRSYVYLASDGKRQVIIKAPAMAHHHDPTYLERFLLEEWVAKRIISTHTMKAGASETPKSAFYTVLEFIDGITLKQWFIDNPKPDIQCVRRIVEQIARGLQALHRKEIIHQDIRPDNIMLDHQGTARIIDFGGARIAGIEESNRFRSQQDLQGTALFAAPEYFLGESGTPLSDQYSLAVLTYHLLSGRFPFGTHIVKARTLAAQRRLTYRSVLDEDREIPVWIDTTLQKALNPVPEKRYPELSEFIHDLFHPSPLFLSQTKRPLIERHPLTFWKSASLVLFVCVLGLLVYIDRLHTQIP